MRCVLAILMLTTAMLGAAKAESLPLDGGVINVRDYGARGDGRNDDTTAILRAISASGADTGRAFWQDRIVYLPNGIYRVSGTLLKRYSSGGFASGLILMGQSEARTTIRLADHAAGFDDPRHPRAVVFTTSKLLDGTPTSGGKDYERLGEGNDAYMNSVEDLTVDVGEGNPGAIGIDYLANNIGAIRNVTLRAPATGGAVGLSMTRKWPGPALIRNLTVNGFSVGIATAQTEYGLTFENIRLDGQGLVALRNDQNVLSIHGITIRGPVPAIANNGNEGFIAIDDGRVMMPEDSGQYPIPISNAGVVALRNLHVMTNVDDKSSTSVERKLTGVLMGAADWRPAVPPSWSPIPAMESDPPPTTPDLWANATNYGAIADPSVDSTEGLRRAFASGAETVYLPHGTYAISDGIDIPSGVRRIVGMYSTFKILPKRQPGFLRTSGMLRAATAGPSLSIERLAFDNTGQGQQLAIEVSGPRDVAIKDVVAAGVTLLDRKAEGGRTFVEDVCCGRMQVAGPRPVFARQFDTEGTGVRILNLGSPLWILGLKTEGVCTILDNRAGARADIFGGLVYMVREGTPLPAFQNSGGWLSASFAEESLRTGSHYNAYLAEELPGGAHTTGVEEFPARGLGRFVPNLLATPQN